MQVIHISELEEVKQKAEDLQEEILSMHMDTKNMVDKMLKLNQNFLSLIAILSH